MWDACALACAGACEKGVVKEKDLTPSYLFQIPTAHPETGSYILESLLEIIVLLI